MTDEAIINLGRYIEAHADERLSLKQLAAQVGLSVAYVQKRFKAVFGLSPKAYQDQLRQTLLRQALREGESISAAIFGAGYGSNSRVYGSKKRQMGMGLKPYSLGGRAENISYVCAPCVLGLLLMAATDKGVCFAMFGADESALMAALKAEFPEATLTEAVHEAPLTAWIEALNHYLKHHGPRPNLPLDMRGTVFQQTVWRALTAVEEGETLTYTQLAQRIGAPKAVRAAASACAKNRIAVLIPCHKVLRQGGEVGQYRWGPERKAFLVANSL